MAQFDHHFLVEFLLSGGRFVTLQEDFNLKFLMVVGLILASPLF